MVISFCCSALFMVDATFIWVRSLVKVIVKCGVALVVDYAAFTYTLYLSFTLVYFCVVVAFEKY